MATFCLLTRHYIVLGEVKKKLIHVPGRASFWKFRKYFFIFYFLKYCFFEIPNHSFPLFSNICSYRECHQTMRISTATSLYHHCRTPITTPHPDNIAQETWWCSFLRMININVSWVMASHIYMTTFEKRGPNFVSKMVIFESS